LPPKPAGGPYVLVGHSYGGLIVRRYAALHPGDVAGIILVDPAHEESRLFYTKQDSWLRVREQSEGRAVPPPRILAPGEGRRGLARRCGRGAARMLCQDRELGPDRVDFGARACPPKAAAKVGLSGRSLARQEAHRGIEVSDLHRRLRSVTFAVRGIGIMLRTQHNAWIHAAATIAVIAVGLGFRLSAGEWCWLVLAIMSVWTAEALNTAFES
jgi:pimeloyl-ACP methyl ester carboxylesterase